MRGLLLAVAGATIFAATSSGAAPLTLTGDYIQVGISDYGTLGSNGSTSPGLLHDKDGNGAFGINDYITPGTPHEGFSIFSTQSGFIQNDNTGSSGFGSASPSLLVGPAANGYANAATWSGSNAFVSLTNSYFFNPGDERILVTTSIVALQNLTSLAFARSVDPDPDVNTFFTHVTNNQRGNSGFGVNDFVGAAGEHTGLTLGLINLSGNTYVHGTQINNSCCSNISPDDVLANPGPVSTTGDHGLNMAWLIGNLGNGETASLSYAYVVGEKIGTVGVPPVSGIPEPATWATMILGFGLMGSMLRRTRRLAGALV